MKSLLGLLQLLFLCGARPVQSQTSGSVLRFQLIQGGTKTVYANLTNNAVIQVPPNTSPNFNLEAITTGGPITSVLFGYNDNANYRVEKTAPYALCGNNAGLFKVCIPPDLGIGSHRVNATITNTGQSRVILFQILNTPVPTPVLAPVVAPTPVLAPVVAPTPVRAPVNAPIPTAVAPTPVIFTFIYTVNNTDITRLVNGTVIKMDDFEQASFNIRAEAINTTAIKSVRLLPINRSETAPPWSYCGETVNGTRVQYRKCVDFAVEGTYTITARPYTGRQQSGTQLPDVAVFFYLVGQPRPPPITTFPFFINCGGPTFSDSQQRTWMEDMYFTGGKTYSNSAIDIVNTVDDAIYQSERYGIFIYQIPVPLGSYSVILHLAEI
jgi:Malectin domain